MGDTEPAGPPSSQTLTFVPMGSGLTLMTMHVEMPESVDPETFMEESAAGLSTSLAAMDELISS